MEQEMLGSRSRPLSPERNPIRAQGWQGAALVKGLTLTPGHHRRGLRLGVSRLAVPAPAPQHFLGAAGGPRGLASSTSFFRPLGGICLPSTCLSSKGTLGPCTQW